MVRRAHAAANKEHQAAKVTKLEHAVVIRVESREEEHELRRRRVHAQRAS